MKPRLAALVLAVLAVGMLCFLSGVQIRNLYRESHQGTLITPSGWGVSTAVASNPISTAELQKTM